MMMSSVVAITANDTLYYIKRYDYTPLEILIGQGLVEMKAGDNGPERYAYITPKGSHLCDVLQSVVNLSNDSN